jgi:hypothetical protein
VDIDVNKKERIRKRVEFIEKENRVIKCICKRKQHKIVMHTNGQLYLRNHSKEDQRCLKIMSMLGGTFLPRCIKLLRDFDSESSSKAPRSMIELKKLCKSLKQCDRGPVVKKDTFYSYPADFDYREARPTRSDTVGRLFLENLLTCESLWSLLPESIYTANGCVDSDSEQKKRLSVIQEIQALSSSSRSESVFAPSRSVVNTNKYVIRIHAENWYKYVYRQGLASVDGFPVISALQGYLPTPLPDDVLSVYIIRPWCHRPYRIPYTWQCGMKNCNYDCTKSGSTLVVYRVAIHIPPQRRWWQFWRKPADGKTYQILKYL